MNFIKENNKDLANYLMIIILIDNGYILKEDIEKQINQSYIDYIFKYSFPFFDKYPEFIEIECLEEICCEEYSENEEKYGKYPEYIQLQAALNNFFNGEISILN